MERRTSPSSRPEPAPEVRCPHCDGRDVELEAAFGGSLMSSQYYCRGCRTVFEWVKRESDDPSEWLR